MPVIGDAYIKGEFPKQLIPGMAELGFFGANLPEEYGCAGLNNVAYGLIMQELERGDSGIRSFASVQGGLVMYPIYAFGSEEQKKHWLPRLAAGQEIGCFGLTEPDFGSNPGGMITTARETKDGWVLNGAKMWITNGSQATVSIIWAKTGAIDDSKSIRGFIVPTDTKGYTARDQKGKPRFARRTRAKSPSKTAWCRRMRSCPRVVDSGARSCASPRHAMASRGVRSVRRWPASSRR
jgi:glutaryl-CoA dehydrogenase